MPVHAPACAPRCGLMLAFRPTPEPALVPKALVRPPSSRVSFLAASVQVPEEEVNKAPEDKVIFVYHFMRDSPTSMVRPGAWFYQR